MDKFRASFSVLNLWSQKKTDDAIKAYFKIDHFVSPAMEAGRKYHEKWSNYIIKVNKLPDELGGYKLDNPISEMKTVIDGKDIDPNWSFLEVVFVPDLIDGLEVIEFKTGISESNSYARSHQGIMYGMLLRQLGYPVNRVRIIHFNQYTGRKDVSFVHLTNKTDREAKDWIYTFACEMHEYLMANNLYEQFKELNDIYLLDD